MYFKVINRVLLGLLMLVPGLMKLFVMKPEAVSGMLDGFGFPAPLFFAWILIALEIVSGIMILGNWKTRYAVWAPIVILAVATILMLVGGSFAQIDWISILFHLTAISNYLLLWSWASHHETPMSHRRR